MADLPDRRPSPELPATIERLHRYVLIGKEVLKAHRARLRAIDKIPDAQDFKVASLQDGQKLAELVLEAEAKLGEMLAAIEPKYSIGYSEGTNGLPAGASPRREPSLPPGITKKESHQAQTIASHPEAVEQVKVRAREEGRIPTAQEVYREIKTPICAVWTGNQESYTPAKYIEAARLVMGSIDLDPASNELAQKTVKAATYYTKEDNGLEKPWIGNIFLNPPYSHPEVKYFVDKLLSELKPGQQAILLTNNNTDTNFFQDAARRAAAMCFTRGRINFLKPDGSISSPTNGQVFYYFGENKEGFIRHFSEFGIMVAAI